MMFTDGTVAHIHLYYCPQLSETLISPQHICTQNTNSFAGFDIQCCDMDNAYVHFYQSPDFSSFSNAPLTCKNNLFYFTQLSLHPQANHLSPQLNTELWHQCLGHPGMHQLCHLQKCTTGIPSGLHQQVIHFTIAKSAVMLEPKKPPWDLQLLLNISSLAHISI
jgi:hypothetical protein